MSMVCFDLADALHAQEKAIQAIEVTDADSLCAYLKAYWELIYNHKMFGCAYNIYDDGVEVRRENGFVIKGIPAVELEIMRMCSAFPDLKVEIPTIFAAPNGDHGYKVWMRYYFSGINSGPSMYGPPSGLKLDPTEAMCMSSFHVELVDGEWLIESETTAMCCDYIRYICTGDSSFTSLKL